MTSWVSVSLMDMGSTLCVVIGARPIQAPHLREPRIDPTVGAKDCPRGALCPSDIYTHAVFRTERQSFLHAGAQNSGAAFVNQKKPAVSLVIRDVASPHDLFVPAVLPEEAFFAGDAAARLDPSLRRNATSMTGMTAAGPMAAVPGSRAALEEALREGQADLRNRPDNSASSRTSTTSQIVRYITRVNWGD